MAKQKSASIEPKITHYLFAWRVDIYRQRTEYSVFYYSLRPVNNPKNAVQHDSYHTRQARNRNLLKVIAANPKFVIRVIRDTNPADWLKARKKK